MMPIYPFTVSLLTKKLTNNPANKKPKENRS